MIRRQERKQRPGYNKSVMKQSPQWWGYQAPGIQSLAVQESEEIKKRTDKYTISNPSSILTNSTFSHRFDFQE